MRCKAICKHKGLHRHGGLELRAEHLQVRQGLRVATTTPQIARPFFSQWKSADDKNWRRQAKSAKRVISTTPPQPVARAWDLRS